IHDITVHHYTVYCNRSYQMPDNKGARRQVQGGALAPLEFAFRFLQNPIQYSCTESGTDRQHLFYRVKYDSRFWCSTSRQKTEMRFNPSLVSEFPTRSGKNLAAAHA